MTQQRNPRWWGAVAAVLLMLASVLVGAAPATGQDADQANLTETIRIPDASSSLIHEASQTLIYIADGEVFLQSISDSGRLPLRVGSGNRINLSPDQQTLLVSVAPTVPLSAPSTFSFHDPISGDVRGTSSGLYLRRAWTSDSKYFYAEPAGNEIPILIEAATGQSVDLPPLPPEALVNGFSAFPASLPEGGALVLKWIDALPGEWLYRAASLVEGNEEAVSECDLDFIAFAVVRDRMLCRFDGPNGVPRPAVSTVLSATIGSGVSTDLGPARVGGGDLSAEIEPGRWLLPGTRNQSKADLVGYDYESDALFTLEGPLVPASAEAAFVSVWPLGDGSFTREIRHAVLLDGENSEDLVVAETSVMRLDGTVVAPDFNAIAVHGDELIGYATDREYDEVFGAVYDVRAGGVVSALQGDESWAVIPPSRRGLAQGNGVVVQGPYLEFEELGFRRQPTSHSLAIRIDDPLGVPQTGSRSVILENFSGDTLVVREVRSCLAEGEESAAGLQCQKLGFFGLSEGRLIVYRVDADGVRSAGPAEDQILRLYRAVFGRSPDAGGFAFWNNAYRGGSSLEAIAAQFQAATEFTDRYGTSPPGAELLDALYANVLGRPGDTGGVAFWLDQLENGMTVPELLVAFAESPENIELTGTRPTVSSTRGQILRIYRAAFGRAPDGEGWAFWTGELNRGVDLASIAAGFAGSAEFGDRYGAAPTDRELVDAMYLNVLARPGDQFGVSFWLDQLDDGLTVPEMLVAFAESPENVVRTGTR